MVTEYPTGRRRRAPAALDGRQDVTLPFSYPPLRGRVTIAALRLLLVPAFAGAVYVFANYPVDKYWLHTEGTVVDAWIAAVVAIALYGFMLVLDGRRLRATADGITVRGALKQHDFAWADVASVAHTETGLTIRGHDGGTHTVQLIERDLRTKVVMPTSPMVRLAADLERVRLQVRAPRALTVQVRVGPARLTTGEWGLWVFVAVVALAVAVARTAGVPAL